MSKLYSNNPILKLPWDIYKRHTALNRLITEVEENITVLGMFASLLRIIINRGTEVDYKRVYYGALLIESERVKGLINNDRGFY